MMCVCRNKPPPKGPLVHVLKPKKERRCQICCCGRVARFSVPDAGAYRLNLCTQHLSDAVVRAERALRER